MSRAARALLALAAFAAAGSPLFADVPVRTEQVIYTLVAFNGKDYSPTFAPESSDTVYVLANTDNFLSVRKTFVYWWPPEGRWQTEASVFNELEPGILEVRRGSGEPRLFELQRYTYFNVNGEYEQNWKVLVGDAADAEVRRAQEIARAYLKAGEEYERQHEAYLAELRDLSGRVEKLKSLGRDWSMLKARMDSLPAPVQPRPPRDYVVPPSPVQGAFVVNLPVGRYRVRLLDHDARVLEGSEKWIVSHAARRINGVGYEVIPGDKWTRPSESRELDSVLYVSGAADLYVSPFFEQEFNDLQYARTTDNGARGNPRIYSWSRIQQVPHAVLLLQDAAGARHRLTEEPYFVQQTRGAGLGYTIVPFTGTGDQEGSDANLKAFRLPVRDAVSESGGMTLKATDDSGKYLPGSDRRIVVVRPGRGTAALVIIVLAPLAVMAAVVIARSRLYSRNRETERRAG